MQKTILYVLILLSFSPTSNYEPQEDEISMVLVWHPSHQTRRQAQVHILFSPQWYPLTWSNPRLSVCIYHRGHINPLFPGLKPVSSYWRLGWALRGWQILIRHLLCHLRSRWSPMILDASEHERPFSAWLIRHWSLTIKQSLTITVFLASVVQGHPGIHVASTWLQKLKIVMSF